MKRFSILFLLTIFSSVLFAQINYCDYFKLEIERTEYNGKIATYISPSINDLKEDTFSVFLKSHKNRFEYILFNRIDSITKFGSIYPDTVKIEKEFCKYLTSDERIKNYLKVLSNTNEQKLVFSQSELLKIASRFFLCDKVNIADTSIGYHICIGINGQKEFQSQRDYTTLEAFCFEAIFFYLNQDNKVRFKENFKSYITKQSQQNKKGFKEFDSFLEKVKQDCYKLMEKDADLKSKLLNYYQNNKNNIGFIIQ